MRLSHLAQDRLDLADAAKHLAQRVSEPRDFDFVPLKRAARYLVGKPQAALIFRRQKHVDKMEWTEWNSKFSAEITVSSLRHHEDAMGSEIQGIWQTKSTFGDDRLSRSSRRFRCQK